MQTSLCLPGDRDRLWVSTGLAAAQRLADLTLEHAAANHQRLDPAAIVIKRGLGPGLLKTDGAEPSQMRLGPVALTARETHVVAKQELGHPVAGAHQISAQILTGTNQISQALRLHRRNADAVKLPSNQQPHEPLRVTLIGLHAIRRSPRDQPRRADQTV